MKPETLNKKIIERLINHYGFKRKDFNRKFYVYECDFGMGTIVVFIDFASVSIDLIGESTSIALAHRYQCTKVSDIDFLLKNNGRLSGLLKI